MRKRKQFGPGGNRIQRWLRVDCFRFWNERDDISSTSANGQHHELTKVDDDVIVDDVTKVNVSDGFADVSSPFRQRRASSVLNGYVEAKVVASVTHYPFMGSCSGLDGSLELTKHRLVAKFKGNERGLRCRPIKVQSLGKHGDVDCGFGKVINTKHGCELGCQGCFFWKHANEARIKLDFVHKRMAKMALKLRKPVGWERDILGDTNVVTPDLIQLVSGTPLKQLELGELLE